MVVEYVTGVPEAMCSAMTVQLRFDVDVVETGLVLSLVEIVPLL